MTTAYVSAEGVTLFRRESALNQAPDSSTMADKEETVYLLYPNRAVSEFVHPGKTVRARVPFPCTQLPSRLAELTEPESSAKSVIRSVLSVK